MGELLIAWQTWMLVFIQPESSVFKKSLQFRFVVRLDFVAFFNALFICLCPPGLCSVSLKYSAFFLFYQISVCVLETHNGLRAESCSARNEYLCTLCTCCGCGVAGLGCVSWVGWHPPPSDPSSFLLSVRMVMPITVGQFWDRRWQKTGPDACRTCAAFQDMWQKYKLQRAVDLNTSFYFASEVKYSICAHHLAWMSLGKKGEWVENRMGTIVKQDDLVGIRDGRRHQYFLLFNMILLKKKIFITEVKRYEIQIHLSSWYSHIHPHYPAL